MEPRPIPGKVAARAFPSRGIAAAGAIAPEHLHVGFEGMACRTRTTAAGGRSITTPIPPGDASDRHVFSLPRMDRFAQGARPTAAQSGSPAPSSGTSSRASTSANPARAIASST